jgi:signal transduction histidine kinase
VYLQRLTNTLLVTVEDDGVGFDLAPSNRAENAPGLGLIGIRERVVRLGGTLRLESAPRKGTRLTVELPARIGGAHDGGETGEGVAAAKPALHEVLGG